MSFPNALKRKNIMNEQIMFKRRKKLDTPWWWNMCVYESMFLKMVKKSKRLSHSKTRFEITLMHIRHLPKLMLSTLKPQINQPHVDIKIKYFPCSKSYKPNSRHLKIKIKTLFDSFIIIKYNVFKFSKNVFNVFERSRDCRCPYVSEHSEMT